MPMTESVLKLQQQVGESFISEYEGECSPVSVRERLHHTKEREGEKERERERERVCVCVSGKVEGFLFFLYIFFLIFGN